MGRAWEGWPECPNAWALGLLTTAESRGGKRSPIKIGPGTGIGQVLYCSDKELAFLGLMKIYLSE